MRSLRSVRASGIAEARVSASRDSKSGGVCNSRARARVSELDFCPLSASALRTQNAVNSQLALALIHKRRDLQPDEIPRA